MACGSGWGGGRSLWHLSVGILGDKEWSALLGRSGWGMLVRLGVGFSRAKQSVQHRDTHAICSLMDHFSISLSHSCLSGSLLYPLPYLPSVPSLVQFWQECVLFDSRVIGFSRGKESACVGRFKRSPLSKRGGEFQEPGLDKTKPAFSSR